MATTEKERLRLAAADPNTSFAVLHKAAWDYPDEVLSNPALSLLAVSNYHRWCKVTACARRRRVDLKLKANPHAFENAMHHIEPVLTACRGLGADGAIDDCLAGNTSNWERRREEVAGAWLRESPQHDSVLCCVYRFLRAFFDLWEMRSTYARCYWAYRDLLDVLSEDPLVVAEVHEKLLSDGVS